MAEVCPKCGLPIELCACKAIEREAQKIKIFIERRKFGKPITIVEGITDRAKELTSQLKSKLACGGTFKNGHVELQGDHRSRLKEILVKLGYSEEQIELS
ncbi:MAG: translation initiation factor [Candidatus Aenigmarchaeota archaeon]|nr:translation initiation factor [Candidatus Aenigmarchaeota archaeon]